MFYINFDIYKEEIIINQDKDIRNKINAKKEDVLFSISN